MIKRLAVKILLMLVLFGGVAGLQAQDAAPEFTPAFLVNSTDGIVFYDMNLLNEPGEIGRLPEGFGIFNLERTLTWRINARGNFMLSPDRRQVAFVAQKPDSASTSLFIYTFETGELDEAVTLQDCPELYPPAINWSPDGQLVAVSPGCTSMTGDSRIVYRLADQQRLSLPDDYIWGYWSADSATLLYIAGGYDIKLFDTERALDASLANLETLTLSSLASPILRACQFTWSDYAGRWFFENGCVSSINSPMDYLYSVDPEGKTRLELALPDFYSALFPQTDTRSYQFINLHSIIAAEDGLFQLVEIGLDYSQWSLLWYEGLPWMRPREIYRTENNISYRDTFADVALTANKELLAMVDFEGNITVVRLPDGTLIGTVEGGVFDNEGATYGLDWLDESRLIYTRTDGGVGIFYRGEADRVDLDLAADFDGEAYIFRRASS